MAASSVTYAQSVAQPGDPVIASSANSPGSEGVANAIDGKPTKYLNFDGKNSQPSGFAVTPGIGSTTITGVSMQTANDAPDRGGFKRIETNPSHPYYGAYYPIGNIGMGYNDMKAIEVRELVQAVAGENVKVWPNFEVAHRIQRCVDATILSHRERRWVNVGEIAD